jgi:hypothetical protein
VPSWHGAISRAYCGTTSLRPLAVQLTAPAASDTSPRMRPACMLARYQLFIEAATVPRRGSKDCEACAVAIAGFTCWIWGLFTRAGARSQGIFQPCLRTSALSRLRSRPASERGRRASPRDRWAGAGADEVHMARLCTYSSPERWEGFPAWRRQTRVPQRQLDVASRFARSPSTCLSLLLRSAIAGQEQLSGCSLCTCISAPVLRHITIWTYYREASIPALPRHWLRLLPLHRRLSRLGKAAISSRPTFSKTSTLHTRPPVLS